MSIEHLHGASGNFYTTHLRQKQAHQQHESEVQAVLQALETPPGENMKYVSEALTIANLAKLFAGGLIHKVGSYLYAKFKGAESKVKAVVADVKKDL